MLWVETRAQYRREQEPVREGVVNGGPSTDLLRVKAKKQHRICMINVHLKLRAFSTGSCLPGEIIS